MLSQNTSSARAKNTDSYDLLVPHILGDYTLHYFELIKQRFPHGTGTLETFRYILGEGGATCAFANPMHTLERIILLFRGHDDLIMRFNAYLPLGFCVDVTHRPLKHDEGLVSDQQRSAIGVSPTLWTNTSRITITMPNGQRIYSGNTARVDTPDIFAASHYMVSLKALWSNSPDTYEKFLDVLREFQRGKIGIADVTKSVSSLLHGHGEYVKGFNSFLSSADQINISYITKSSTSDPITSLTASFEILETRKRPRLS